MKTKTLDYYMGLSYSATIEQYEEDGKIIFSLTIPDLTGVWANGKTLEEAYEKLNEAKQLWFETCLEEGIEIPEPESVDDFSGKFIIRLDPKMHMRLSKEARRKGLSLNQYVKSAIENEIHGLKTESEINLMKQMILSQNRMINQVSEDQKRSVSELKELIKNIQKAPLRTQEPCWSKTVIVQEGDLMTLEGLYTVRETSEPQSKQKPQGKDYVHVKPIFSR